MVSFFCFRSTSFSAWLQHGVFGNLGSFLHKASLLPQRAVGEHSRAPVQNGSNWCWRKAYEKQRWNMTRHDETEQNIWKYVKQLNFNLFQLDLKKWLISGRPFRFKLQKKKHSCPYAPWWPRRPNEPRRVVHLTRGIDINPLNLSRVPGRIGP